jgi:signal transduction histidine kinase
VALQRRILVLFLLFATEPLLVVGAAVYLNPSAAFVAEPAPYWRFALGVGLIVVAGTVVFVLALKRALRPLADLTEAADRIAKGDFTPWLPIPRGNDEVSRLTMAFGTMALRLRDLVQEIEVTRPVRVLGEFAGQLAHEVRTPLSSVRLNLQRMERGLRDGRVPQELGEPVELCLREVRRLDDVVRGALLVGQMHNGGREEFRLRDRVIETVRLLGAEAMSRRVSIEVDWAADDDRVTGNPQAMQSVFLNLLRNAMDVVPDGGAIRIRSADVRGAGAPWIRVHVVDDGPGVRPELRDRIFQPYFTTKSSGVGLGLALARATVEAYGGRLHLERRSELEKGAEFVVALPLNAVVRVTPHRESATV